MLIMWLKFTICLYSLCNVWHTQSSRAKTDKHVTDASCTEQTTTFLIHSDTVSHNHGENAKEVAMKLTKCSKDCNYGLIDISLKTVLTSA